VPLRAQQFQAVLRRLAPAGTAVIEVTENPELERYEIRVDGALAGFTEYRGHTDTRTFTHTEIDPAFEGQGLGSQLISRTLDDLRARDLKAIPICPFVKAFLDRHPEYLDVVDPRIRRAFGLPDP
jgi:predicted GNAT family acetyltransferase